MSSIILLVVVFLAWSNGANDNFKGVATLYGSGTTSYRKALAWATVTTLAGALLTLTVAAALVTTFSAKGLVPDEVATTPAFLGAAALGAALTVLVATWAGLPVSTTHALTGALLGAGLASRTTVNFEHLGKSFLLPLVLSPFLSRRDRRRPHRVLRRPAGRPGRALHPPRRRRPALPLRRRRLLRARPQRRPKSSASSWAPVRWAPPSASPRWERPWLSEA